MSSDDTVVVEPLTPFGVRVGPGADATALRRLVRTHHLVLIRDVSPDRDLAAWSGLLGELMIWPFGAVLDIRDPATAPDSDMSDVDRSDVDAVPFHWDGMYQAYTPDLLVLHCVATTGAHAPAGGSRTLFTDTSLLLDGLDGDTLARWRRVSFTYPIPTRSPRVATSPLVVAHPVTGVATMRYREQPEHPMHAELMAALTSPRYCHAHRWRTGDLVLADNHAVLHGRAPGGRSGPHLRRVHVLGTPAHRNPALA